MRRMPTATAVRVGLKPENCAAECLDFIEHQLFVHLVSPDEVAAIVVEPIQGEGGYVVAPDQFLQRLRELTHDARHPAGRRRSAVRHGAHRADVRDRARRRAADVVAIAKGIASGMPLGVDRGARRSDDVAARRARDTFGGNPVSCAAALATIKLLKDQLIANAADVGAHLMDGLDGADGQASADRRRPRARPDDRRRAGARSADEGARDRRARRRRQRGVPPRAAGARRRQELDPLLAAARPDAEQADTAVRIFDEALTEVRRGADRGGQPEVHGDTSTKLYGLCLRAFVVFVSSVVMLVARVLLGRMSRARRSLGKSAKISRVEELERRGYAILARRYRRRGGELDIVARDGATLVFVEVKARDGREFGGGGEAVTRAQAAADAARWRWTTWSRHRLAGLSVPVRRRVH